MQNPSEELIDIIAGAMEAEKPVIIRHENEIIGIMNPPDYVLEMPVITTVTISRRDQ